MIQIVHYLNKNPDVLQLLKDNKLSLVGVSKSDLSAIIEAFEENTQQRRLFWF